MDNLLINPLTLGRRSLSNPRSACVCIGEQKLIFEAFDLNGIILPDGIIDSHFYIHEMIVRLPDLILNGYLQAKKILWVVFKLLVRVACYDA